MIVKPDGPLDAEVTYVGESPGRQEARMGKGFVGPSGDELWALSPWLRSACRIANLVQEYTDGNPDPTDAQIDFWGPILEQDLAKVQPSLVVAVGRFSATWFLGSYNPERDRGDLHRVRRPWGWLDVIPITHPAAGFHDPTRYQWFVEDMAQVRRYHEGALRMPQERQLGTYQWYTGPALQGEPYDAVDTEFDRDGLISIQVSQMPGEGLVLRPDQEIRWEAPLVFHNALADASLLNYELAQDNFEDTLLLARLLNGTGGNGLKTLAWRMCRIKLRDFEEVIGPYDNTVVREWLEAREAEFTPVFQERISEKTGKVLKPKKLPDASWVKCVRRALKSDHPRKLWNDQTKRNEDAHVGCPRDMPPMSLRCVPEDEFLAYAGADADVTGRIFPLLRDRVRRFGLVQAYETAKGAFPVLQRIQDRGILTNPAHFHALTSELDYIIAVHMEKIHSIPDVPEDYSPTSPLKTSELIYGTLELKPRGRVKRMANGWPSSDDAFLQALKDQHPVVQYILNVREAVKLKGSYTAKLPKIVGEDNIYHPDFGFTVTSRLTESIMLLIPKHSSWKMGKLIRAGFIPRPGNIFGSWDLSQIELRVLASDSQDPGLLSAYQSGIDLHALTAHRVLGAPERKEDQDPSKHRLPAKSLNFGIPMGLSGEGLMREILASLADGGATEEELDSWNVDRCQEMIDIWYEEAYPVAGEYLRGKAEEAREKGYVTDWMGAIRWLPGVNSPNDKVRSEAERQAQSFPMQSGAARVGQLWQAQIWEQICKRDVVEPVCWVHDDMILEIPEGRFKEIDQVMHGVLPQVLNGVPVECEGVSGQNWGELA